MGWFGRRRFFVGGLKVFRWRFLWVFFGRLPFFRWRFFCWFLFSVSVFYLRGGGWLELPSLGGRLFGVFLGGVMFCVFVWLIGIVVLSSQQLVVPPFARVAGWQVFQTEQRQCSYCQQAVQHLLGARRL